MKKMLAILAIGAMSAPAVYADPIITLWSVDQYATFQSATTDGVAPSYDYTNVDTGAPSDGTCATVGGCGPDAPYDPIGTPVITGDELSWGDPVGEQSRLFITVSGDSNGTADALCDGQPDDICGAVRDVTLATNATEFEDTLAYNHENNVLFASGGSLTSGEIVGRVDLSAVDPDLGYLGSDSALYSFTFAETANTDDGETFDDLGEANLFCNSLGFPEGLLDVTDPADTCPDVIGIFSDDLTVDGEGRVVFSDTINLGPLGSYTVFVALEGLVAIGGENCVATATNPCFGLVTQEGEITTFKSSLRIVAVPAPAVPALLGLGLLAMVGIRRRKALKNPA